jgi:hypothetical protein
MGEFCTRALAMLLTAAILIVVIPVALKLLFTIGPVGFVLLLVALFALGAVLFD